MEEKLFSICIPSYNRPAEIRRLLNSIDTTHVDEVEIVICEDKSLNEKKYANRFLISSQRHDMRLTISKMRKIVVMTRISVTLFV